MTDLIPLIVAVGLPTIALLMNIAARKHSGLPWSAGADLLMLAVLLDATMLTSGDAFKELVQHDDIRELFYSCVVFLLLFTLLLWFLVVSILETRLITYFDSASASYNGTANTFKALGCLFLAIISVLLIVGAHVTLFLYGKVTL